MLLFLFFLPIITPISFFLFMTHYHLFVFLVVPPFLFFFFFNDTAPPEIYTFSLHDAFPISKYTIGTDDVDVEAATELGVLVTHGPTESNWGGVAEGTITAMLTMLKKVRERDRHLKQRGEWRGARPTTSGFAHPGRCLPRQTPLGPRAPA